MANKENKVKVYSTKLYEGTIGEIKALAQAGKIQQGDNYGERQVIEEALDAYRKARPDRFAAADKYLAAVAELRQNAPDEPISE